MTKKDYIQLAKIINKNSSIANMSKGITHVIKNGQFMIDLCEYLRKDNPKFDEVKFREATGEIIGR
jgi:hypothetical protein